MEFCGTNGWHFFGNDYLNRGKRTRYAPCPFASVYERIVWWYLFLCRSASWRRRIFLAQAGQYFARLDFGVKLAPHSQHRFK